MLAAIVQATSGEAQKSGPLALVVILLLCIACYYLFKSMSKHLRKVREDFPAELPPDPLRPDDQESDAEPSATPTNDADNGSAVS